MCKSISLPFISGGLLANTKRQKIKAVNSTVEALADWFVSSEEIGLKVVRFVCLEEEQLKNCRQHIKRLSKTHLGKP